MLADEGLLSGASLPGTCRSLDPALHDRSAPRPAPGPREAPRLRAAVVGAPSPGLVASLNGVVDDVETALETLAGLDVADERPTSTVRGEREFAFKHALIRDVAYERLPKGLRAELHVRCADWFASRQERDEFAEAHAYHLEQACRLAREIERSPIAAPVVRAAEALRIAAEKAERREGLQEADRLYARALELVGDEHPETAAGLRLRRARSEPARQLGRSVRAVPLGRGRGRCRRVGGAARGGSRRSRQRPPEAGSRRGGALRADRCAGHRGGDGRCEARGADAVRAVGAEARLLRRAGCRRHRPGARRRARGRARRSPSAGGRRAAKGLRPCCGRAARTCRAGPGAKCRDRLRARQPARRVARNLPAGVRRLSPGTPRGGRAPRARAQEWFERTGDSYFRVQNLRSLSTFALARDDGAEAGERRLRRPSCSRIPPVGGSSPELNADLASCSSRWDASTRAEDAVAVATDELPEGDPAARGVVCVAAACVAERAAIATPPGGWRRKRWRSSSTSETGSRSRG